MRFHVETYGCAANRAESEIMAGLLANAGHEQSGSAKKSEAIIFNTCFVKEPTQQKMLRRIKDTIAEFPGKRIIIAGCMPEVLGEELMKRFPGCGIVSTHHVTRIQEALDELTRGKLPVFTGRRGEEKLCLGRKRENPLIGITEISQGCTGECAYCCVRLAKGRLVCYDPRKIVKDVEKAVSEGCMEIWLTSQDNASYSHGSVRLPELIGKVCAIKGGFMIRVGMMNPDHALPIANDLVEAFKDEKVYKFLHLPVQSGSDRILGLMKRKYKASEFAKIVKEFRKSFPMITISTDLIVGFPGESDKDFEKTMDLLRTVRPDVVNVSKFGARPGTEASKMVPVEPSLIKKRSAEASALARKIAAEWNRKWIGWEGEALFTERGSGGGLSGRNFAYKPVVVSDGDGLPGRRSRVIVKKAAEASLGAEVK